MEAETTSTPRFQTPSTARAILTSAETIAYFRLSESGIADPTRKLARLRSRGILKGIRTGRSWTYRIEDVIACAGVLANEQGPKLKPPTKAFGRKRRVPTP